MILHIFAVRDSATDQFGNPMFLISAGHAVRSFSDEVNREDKDSLIYRHPDDYALFSLGEFDTATGIFSTGTPKQVTTGKMVKVRS